MDLQKILSVDIETVPREIDFSVESIMFPTWKSKHRKSELTDEELISLYNKEAGLYAEYCQIVCISVSYFHEDKVYAKSFMGEENELLQEFIEFTTAFKSKRGGLILAGHNILNFDIPVIRVSYCRYFPLINFPNFLSDLNINNVGKEVTTEKPWLLTERVLDTLHIQKGSRYSFSSMAETAIALGLPSPKLDTDGSKVAEMFREGKLKEIGTYCIGDTYTVIMIICKWFGLEIPPLITVTEKTKPKKLNVLQKLASDIVPSEEEMAILDARIENMEGEEKEIALEIKAAAFFRDKPFFD